MNNSIVHNEVFDLKNHPLIREYASVSDDTYALIKATNPTLRFFVDVAKKIVNEGHAEC